MQIYYRFHTFTVKVLQNNNSILLFMDIFLSLVKEPINFVMHPRKDDLNRKSNYLAIEYNLFFMIQSL